MNFNNIAALKASATPVANDTALVLGYYAPGDSGGGDFYWDASSTLAEDYGTVFTLNTAPATGRWKRLLTGTQTDVRWFGAKGDGATDDTIALNRCATYVRTSSTRRVFYFSVGVYLTGKIDITGIYMINSDGPRVKITGKPGEDIFYWKGNGEVGYVNALDVNISNLYIELDGSVDVRSNYTRVGFEAERVGNCAFHFGVPNGIVFDKIRINSINGPSGAPGYGSCGLFFSGPAYKTNFGTKFEVRYTDYGVIVGTSNYYNAVIPLEVTAIDDTTNTLTVNNTYVANNQVVLIWDNNDGSLTGINRRSEKLYVVNPTATTIQVSKTSGGLPFDFSVSGTPQVWVFPSGADTLEFSCDEWSSQQLTTVTNRVGFSGVNHARCTFGELDCQSNAVAFRLLSYQSANYFSSHNIFISDLYTEGPGFTTYMVNKDFVLIEGYEVVINNGPMCNTTAVLNNNVTFKTYESQFYNVGAKNNYLQLLGNRNTIGVLSESGESLIKNYGADNVLTFCRRSNGDAPNTPRVISKYSLNKPLGGFWPDYIATGNSTTPYQSNQVLMQLAIELQFQSAPVIEYRYDDTTLDVNGYVRKTASGTLAMRYAFGKNSESFAAGKYFPSSRWRLYAKVRSVAAQNITVGFSQTGGGTTYNGSSVTNVGTSWTTIFVDLNHTGAPAGSTGDLYVTGASGAFDLAYVYILPYNGETFSLQNNYGGGLIDAAGTGSPDTVLTAAIGSTFRRRDGIAGASFYVKQTGTGNTGWVAIG